MSPSSRPPLTTRIRASFEGNKLRKEVALSPTHANGFFATQDPETLRNAIDQALNSDAFQSAIASHLARIIEPSIKSALDTIQPVVETVYNHDILLRNINKSVENLLTQTETITEEGNAGPPPSSHAEAPKADDVEAHPGPLSANPPDKDIHNQSKPSPPQDVIEPPPPAAPQEEAPIPLNIPAGKLAGAPDTEQSKHLDVASNTVKATNLGELSISINASNAKISEMEEGIVELNAALAPILLSLPALRSFSETSTTATSVIQAQLDQLKADMGLIIDAIPADLGAHVKSIRDEVAARDTSLLSSHTTKLDDISAGIASLKMNGDSENTETLRAVSANLQSLKEHIETGIVSRNNHFNTLDSQIAHAISTIEAQTSTLADIKAADTSADILAAVHKSNDSHESHAAVLSEIKERSLISGSESAPVPGDSIQETTSKLQALSAEILAAVNKSNDSHALHSAALEEIKSLKAAPVTEPVLDTNSFDTATALQNLTADLASLKENITAGLASNGDSLTDLGTKIDDFLTTLEAHREADPSAEILAGVQKSNDSHTALVTMLEGLRPLNEAPATEAAPITDNTNLANLETSISNIATTLHLHTTTLEEIKTANTAPAVDAGNSGAAETHTTTIIDTLSSHKTALDEILRTLDSHTTLLTELKDDVGAEILTGLHDCNEAHAAHKIALTEIQEADVSDEILTALHSSNDSHASHAAGLIELQASVNASNESLAAHTSALEEIKAARTVEPGPSADSPSDFGGLEVQINAINTTLESHSSTLSEIKEAANALNDSHAVHAATLTEIKDATTASNDSHASHTAMLAELKSIDPSAATPSSAEDANLAVLETQINTVISKLETQTVILSDIKAANSYPEVLSAVKESHDLLNTQHDLLTSHTSLLNSIKESNTHDDILANITSLKSMVEESRADVDAHGKLVTDLHADTKTSNATITSAIEALAVGGVAGAGAEMIASKAEGDTAVTAEILEEVKAIRAVVEKSSGSMDAANETITSIFSQIGINHVTTTTSITSLGDELKAEIDASATELTSSITALSGDIKDVDFAQFGTAVEEARKEIDLIGGMLETLDGHVESTGAQVAELLDGVCFNEKGLLQLAEHAMVRGVAKRGEDRKEARDASKEIDEIDSVTGQGHIAETETATGNEPDAELIPEDGHVEGETIAESQHLDGSSVEPENEKEESSPELESIPHSAQPGAQMEGEMASVETEHVVEEKEAEEAASQTEHVSDENDAEEDAPEIEHDLEEKKAEEAIPETEQTSEPAENVELEASHETAEVKVTQELAETTGSVESAPQNQHVAEQTEPQEDEESTPTPEHDQSTSPITEAGAEEDEEE